MANTTPPTSPDTPEDAEAFLDWIEKGVEAGWISAPVCSTHDVLPQYDDEWEAWDEGEDPCIPAVRIWKFSR